MILAKILAKLNKTDREDIVVGLVLGLVAGLVWGLVLGLVVGLVLGLVLGLVVGLVLGLVLGLVWGLVVGLVLGLVWGLVAGFVVILLHFAEAFPFLHGLFPILILVGCIMFIVEMMFWVSKDKPPKKGLFWYTCKMKGGNLVEVLFALSALSQVYILGREIDFVRYLPQIIKWLGYIALVALALLVIVGIFYLWIKLNMVKYDGGK